MPFINYRIFSAISYSGVTSPLVSILSPFRIRNRWVLDSFILIFTSFNFPLYFFHLFFSLYCILCYFLQVTLILPFCIFSYLTHSLEFFVCFNDFVFNFYYYYWFFKKSACFLSCLAFLSTAYFLFYASNDVDNYFVVTFQYLYHLICLRTILFISPADLTCGRFPPHCVRVWFYCE